MVLPVYLKRFILKYLIYSILFCLLSILSLCKYVYIYNMWVYLTSISVLKLQTTLYTLDNSHFLPTLLARKDPKRSATVFQTHQPIKRLCKGLDLLLLLPRVTCEQWKCWTLRMSNVLPHGLVMANWKTVEVETWILSLLHDISVVNLWKKKHLRSLICVCAI